VAPLHQRTCKKGNAGRFAGKQGLIDDPIDKRAAGDIAEWARAWRSFQPWGPY
jgi:hypothetical protein